MSDPTVTTPGTVSERDRSILRALAARIDTNDAEAHNNLGVLYFNKRMLEEALEQFGAALSIDDASRIARVNLAYTLRALGHTEEADRETALLERHRDADERDVWSEQGEESALAIRRLPATPEGLLSQPEDARPSALPQGFLAHYHRGIVYRERGAYTEALDAFHEALAAGEQQDVVEQAMAEVHLAGGQPQEAANLYDALLAGNPNSPKLWNERGVCHHILGELESAADAYRRAIELDSGYGLAENNLAVTCANRGDAAAAVEILRGLTRRRSCPEALCNAGLLAMEQGRVGDAVGAYRLATSEAPDRPAGWIGLGAALAEEGSLAAARNAMVRGVELAPKSAEGRYRLAFILNRLGDVRGSLDETRKALALDPYFTAPRPVLAIELQFEYSEVLAPEVDSVARLAPETAVSGFAFEPGQLSAAIARLRGEEDEGKRTESGPPAPGAGFESAEKLLARGALPQALAEIRRRVLEGGDPVEGAILSGEALQRQGLDGEAVERFEAATVRLDGQRWSALHSRAWIGLGSCLLSLGRVGDAIEAADALRANAPDNPRGALFRAEAFLAAERAGEAFELLSLLVAREPRNAAIRASQAIAAKGAGRTRVAQEILLEALEIDPDLAYARLELGALLLAEHRLAEAAEQGREALAILPGYAEAARLVADAEVAAGRLDAAVAVLVELLEDDSYHLPSLLYLGRILLDAGRVADARVALRRVMRLNPDAGDAWIELGRSYQMEGRTKEAAACRAQATALGAKPPVAEDRRRPDAPRRWSTSSSQR